MRKIILDYNFNFRQKAILIAVFSIFLIFFVKLIISFNNFFNNGKTIIFLLTIFISLFFLFFLFFFIAIIFIKKGFLVKEKSLFYLYTFAGKTLYIKEIKLNKEIKFTVLKNRVIYQNTYLSAGSADLSYRDIIYKLVLLNKDNTVKETIFITNKIKQIDRLKEFIKSNNFLQYSI